MSANVAKSSDSFPLWAETGFGAPRRELARWFRANARDLPWRRDRSVYRTVVSEFMLQQTRVATVLPYFERWMEAFPDFAALAAAEEKEVLSLWQGLGYYSRARNLHKLARLVTEEGVPSDAKGWKALPGVGDYTAAAVASIAEGVSVAVVDGNVVRVLARLSADERRWGSSGEAVRGYAPMAAAFLDPRDPGLHNEALMELGALVCLPRSPLCTVCPLVGRCGAAARGLADSLPRVAKSKKTERTVRRAWAVEGGSVLLRETPDGSKRLAGLLELPALEDLPRTGDRIPSLSPSASAASETSPSRSGSTPSPPAATRPPVRVCAGCRSPTCPPNRSPAPTDAGSGSFWSPIPVSAIGTLAVKNKGNSPSPVAGLAEAGRLIPIPRNHPFLCAL